MESPLPSSHPRTFLSPLPQPKPTRRSLVLPTPHLQEEEEEDARSARQRRHSRGFSRVISLSKDQAAQESHLPWSQDQLKQHYSQCMKLSQENKINHKNAFELQLIEHMGEMIRKDGALNFRTAGGTIYAGAKIYASRVDAIYSEIYRVMNSLGGGEKEDKEAEEEPPEGDPEAKTKRRKKNSKILESNVSNLLVANILAPVSVDSLERAHNLIDAASCDSLKLNNLSVACNGTLLYDNQLQQFDTQASPSDEAGEVPNTFAESTKQISSEVLGVEQGFADTLGQLDFDIADLNSTISSQDEITNGELPTGGSQEEGLIFEDNGTDYHDDDDIIARVESTSDEVFTSHQAMSHHPDMLCNTDMLRNTDMSHHPDMSRNTDHHEQKLSLCLASSPGEYSYFKPNVLAAFDSNRHWKRSRKPLFAATEGDQQDAGEVPSQAKKRKKSARRDFELESLVRDKKLQPQKMSRQKLAALKVGENRAMQRSGNDRRAYARAVSVKVRLEPLSNHRLLGHWEAPESKFEYDNDEFCPALSPPTQDDDDCVFEGTPFPDLTCSKLAPPGEDYTAPPGEDYLHLLEGDHLVSQPRKIERVVVTFAKRAKHMDVKKLKVAMWGMLKIEEPSETDQQSDVTDHDVTGEATKDARSDVTKRFNTNEGILFSEMYRHLPSKMSEKMADNLSPHLAFTCLLHLANEKGLRIVGRPTLSDLTITHEL